MKKASRAIIYKEKESIRFFLGKGKTLEYDFNNKLWERPFWGELDNKAQNALRLFNNACYICTCAFYDDYSPNELEEYEKIAIDGHDDNIWKKHIVPATMALVVNWLSSEECKKISLERGRMDDIGTLCRRIRVNFEENNVLPLEGKEDFQALIIQDYQHPSGFINDGSFLRNSFSEAMDDPTVKPIDIFNSVEFFVDIIKNNPSEWTSVVDPDSYFLKELPNLSASKVESKLRDLWETLNNKFKEDTENLPVREDAFNGQEQSNRKLHEMVNLCKSNICIADDRKIDVIKVLHAMCKMGLFKTKDGSNFSIKAVMEFFGEILNDNFSEYSSNLSTSKSTAKEDTFWKSLINCETRPRSILINPKCSLRFGLGLA